MDERDSAQLFAVAAESYDRLMGRYLPTLGVAFADAAGVRTGQRASVRAHGEDLLGQPTGSFTLQAHAWCAVGRVPF